MALTILPVLASDETPELTFNIKGYMVEGNSLLDIGEIDLVLMPFVGEGKTAQTVNKAKATLESHYHHQGYPAVLVNIPLQTLENDMVKLQVIESKISRVRVSGNKYFTMKRLMRSLPSIRPGSILYLPQLEKELNKLNRNQHILVAPVLSPGKDQGAIDVELKVKDQLPLHGSLELNNYATHSTTDLRANVKVSYDNFFQRDQSLSLQFQTSPEDMDEVKVVAISYLMNSCFNSDHLVALYGVWSDSEVSYVESMLIIGKGKIGGLRYIIPLPGINAYYHNFTIGLDYKDFDDAVDMKGSDDDSPTTIQYMPLSLSYGATFQDNWANNQLNFGISKGIRSFVASQKEFDQKRVGARSSYLRFTSSWIREQQLYDENFLFTRVNFQLADMPLLSNEQFFAGGANSVRGYKENEITGDTGVSGTLEVRFLNLVSPVSKNLSWLNKFSIRPYYFYDIASVNVKQPLEGQSNGDMIHGMGIGLRGACSRFFNYEVNLGYPLSETEYVETGDWRFYFKVIGEF